jgi:hypothetical protein
VPCPTREECEAFLAAVSGDIGYDGPRGGVSQPVVSVDEPVIDGSKVPDVIDFNEPPTPPVVDKVPPKTPGSAADSAPPPASLANDTAAGPNTPFIRPLVVVDQQQIAPHASMFDLSPNSRDAVGDFLEDRAAGVFDAWRRSPDGFSPGSQRWMSFLVKQFIRNQARDYLTNTVSRQMFGRDLSEMPEPFQRDLAVDTAAVTRIYKPFSLQAGYELVRAMGAMFDLWN